MDNMKLAQRIKSRRIELGLTLQDVADKMGINRSTILRYENGAIVKAKLPVLKALAETLKVSETYLLGFDGELPDNSLTILRKSIKEHYGSKTVQLIENMDKLNDEGQSEALKQVENLTYIPKYQKAYIVSEAAPEEDYINPEDDPTFVIAAHAQDGATEEDLQEDLDIARKLYRELHKNG